MASNDPHYQREQEKYAKPVASREHLLEIIQSHGQPLSFKEICNLLSYQDKELQIGVKRRLRAMENAGQIIFNRFKKYAIASKTTRVEGTVIGHRDGYGFLAPDDGSKDLYIPFHEMKRVFHGDKVAALISESADKKGRQEVRIVDMLERRSEQIIGRVFIEYNVATVVPDDARIGHDLIIPPSERQGARHGQMVIVEIIQWPTRHAGPVGQIVEVLGDHMAPGMEIQVALRNHDLPHIWPEAIESEIDKLSDEVEESAKVNRVDLRHLPLVTIDGEDARDFDDAVYCEVKKSGGWRLWVAIADVSYYVRPGTALDGEAINRGNSVYFPEQVIPMLPEKLSNGLCSLNPHVDRLCMVCEMTISSRGKLSGTKFYPAVMNSHARFTYTQVGAILEGDLTLREKHRERVGDLENLHRLYHALVHARRNRGAIEFETEETRFIFNAQRKIAAIEPVIRNDAHKIIEECMILANVATAKFVEKHQAAGLFRIHDKPNEEKYNNFVSYLAELGITIPHRTEPEPRDYGEILEKVDGRPDFELIQTMLLRSMKQAVYSNDNIGHFGLALEQYSHFTSPIRRYPDLVIHRVIKALLEQQDNSEVNQGFYLYSPEQVMELGEHCSMTERRADEATRDVADWLKCEFMQDHVGDEFTGVISTVTNFGFFVRLQDIHIEGLVHISSLGQDYYNFDEKRMRLIGEKTRKKYHVGDLLKVKVAAVNLDEKKIDLTLAGADAVLSTGIARTNKAKKQKKAASKFSGREQNKSTREMLLAGDIPDDLPKGNKGKANKEAPANKGSRDESKKSASGKKKTGTKKAVKKKAVKRTVKKSRPGKNARNKAK
jgi:ribonuclease R